MQTTLLKRFCIALALLVLAVSFTQFLLLVALLGWGTAMVYPTLIAAVSDVSLPLDRARSVGVYRFWRDSGFVLGALVAGVGADTTSPRAAIAAVAALTAASGLAVAVTTWQRRPTFRARTPLVERSL